MCTQNKPPKPVSGLWQGKTGPISLHLRIDVDEVMANSPVLNKLSGDFFGESNGKTTYLGSWIVLRPKSACAPNLLTIAGKADFAPSGRPKTTISIEIPWDNERPGAATARFGDMPGQVFTCEKVAGTFRQVDLEVDLCRSVAGAPMPPSFDMRALAGPGPNQRNLNFETAFAEAGIGINMKAGASNLIDDGAMPALGWNRAELHGFMQNNFGQIGADWPSWNIWGLLAGTFDSGSVGEATGFVAGIMFDDRMSPPPGRQGFAVFRNHHWFEKLKPQPTTDDEQMAARQFLFIWVHEAGHAFNMVHSFEKGRPRALSWMNYPHGFGPSFWKKFGFSFDAKELLHLRHGSLKSVIMGGDPSGSLAMMGSAEALPPIDGSGAALELLIRSKGAFEFMEPVFVEIRLRNLSGKARDIDPRFGPEFHIVRYFIEKPDGTVVEYGALAQFMVSPVAQKLAKNSARPDGSDRLSQEVFLGFGKDGFYFDTPGRYSVWAKYGHGKAAATSKPHPFEINEPSGADRPLCDALRSEQAGLWAYLGGSRSGSLRAGADAVQNAIEKLTGGPATVAKLSAMAAQTLARDFRTINMDGPGHPKTQVLPGHGASPEKSLEISAAALRFYQEKGGKQDNLAFSKLVHQRAGCHQSANSPEAAATELELLLTKLKERKVKPAVLAGIEKTGLGYRKNGG